MALTLKFLEHMMYLNALGQPILIINDLKTAFELLDRRASIYSDRPDLIVANGILCGGLNTASMPYGDVLVCPFIPGSRNLSFLVGGVALAAPHMKFSPEQSFPIITQFFVKRQSSFLLQYWTTQALWRNTSSVPPLPPPCRYYMIILRWKTKMMRPLRKSALLSIACRQRLLLERF